MVDIKKPEITKNISTPINPPTSSVGKAWKQTTQRTAIALKPSMSGRYLGCVKWFFDLSIMEVKRFGVDIDNKYNRTILHTFDNVIGNMYCKPKNSWKVY